MRILVTGAWQTSNERLDMIRVLGHELVFMQNEEDELPCPYETVDAIICNGLFLHHSIEKFSSLKYIQLTSSGFDRLDMNFISTNSITIYNAAGVYSIPMAEFAISSVLSFYKQSTYFREAQNEHSWKKHRGLEELNCKRICIVGCGNVGDECAKRFSAFGCKVVGIDVKVKSKQMYDVIYPVQNLSTVLHDTDVLILTVPLTEENHHLIKEEELDSLPENSIVVNISRGGVIDTRALVKALKANRLRAVLDVFENEPLEVDSALWDLPNAIITPHNSFVGEGNPDRLWNVIYKNLELYNENSNYIAKK